MVTAWMVPAGFVVAAGVLGGGSGYCLPRR